MEEVVLTGGKLCGAGRGPGALGDHGEGTGLGHSTGILFLVFLQLLLEEHGQFLLDPLPAQLLLLLRVVFVRGGLRRRQVLLNTHIHAHLYKFQFLSRFSPDSDQF